MGVGKVKKGRKASFTVFADIMNDRNNTVVKVVAGGYCFKYEELKQLGKMMRRIKKYEEEK